MQTVICIRWGTVYGVDYINRLYRGVMRHVRQPTRFVAFTDDPSGLAGGIEAKPIPTMRLGSGLKPGPWRKLALWAADLGGLEGDVLFLDLDVLVTGNIDPLFAHEPGKLILIRNWTQGRRDGIGNSSVMRFRAGSAPHLVTDFEADAVAMSYRFDNEQIYVTKQSRLPLAFWPPAWCPSFKHDLLPPWPAYLYRPPLLPPDARIVVFTGHPRPDEALEGRWPARWYKKFYKSIPPVAWIGDHWR
jgi:hypothetical protein